MKPKSKLKYLTALLAAVLLSGVNAFAGSTGSMKVIRTEKQAAALPEDATKMMACSGCQTIKPIEKKGILTWFATKVKHDCPSCGGKVTFKNPKTGGAKFTHTCSMCGDVSAYVCATH